MDLRRPDDSGKIGKLEYDFNDIMRIGTPGTDPGQT